MTQCNESDRPPFDNGSSLVAMAQQDRAQREEIVRLRLSLARIQTRGGDGTWSADRCAIEARAALLTVLTVGRPHG